MDGRIVATAQGAGCMFLYGDWHGGRISLFVRPMHGHDKATMRPAETAATAGYAWAHAGLGVSRAARRASSLHALSDRVRDQMGART